MAEAEGFSTLKHCKPLDLFGGFGQGLLISRCRVVLPYTGGEFVDAAPNNFIKPDRGLPLSELWIRSSTLKDKHCLSFGGGHYQ